MNKGLEGRSAIVFGASPHIGGTVGMAMAESGAAVAFCDLNHAAALAAAQFLNERGHTAFAIEANASREDEVAAALRTAHARLPGLDILVNLSGRQRRFAIVDFDPAQWREQMDSYALSAALTTKHFARVLVEGRRPGAVVHIASDAAAQGEPGNSGYSAAKAAVVNFCRAAAAELGVHGIRVNTISPTYMENNLWKYGYRENRDAHSTTAQDFLSGIPLRRFCRAADVAGAAVFLASDEASFISGVDLRLDGAGAKYWAWRPGEFNPLLVEEYVRTASPAKYGEGHTDVSDP